MVIYKILSVILFIILMPPYILIRAFNGKGMYGWREKLGFLKVPELGDKIIMFHGVSVGEVIALENLVKKTREVFQDYKIVITTGTKTGQEIAQKKYKDIAAFITYFPYDIAPCVQSFLKKVKPSIVMIAETEIWPIFADECKKMSIPLLTINGRISDSTYNIYRFFKNFFAYTLSKYTRILTQSQEDMEKFLELGAPKNITKVMKNLKFDVKKSDTKLELEKGNPRLIIAGSTHGQENPVVIKVFKNFKQEFPDIKLLIAPRHFKRIPEIKDLAEKYNLSYGLRSENDNLINNDVLILDTMGELGKLYASCNFAFIGGSFNKTGGHNPLEAVVFNKPAISGPSIHNFRDIYWILGRSKAGKVVKNPAELTDYMRKLLSDKEFYNQACEDCKTVFEDQQGALDIVIGKLKNIL